MKQTSGPRALCGAHIRIRGAVQGVGFRPFLYRLARELALCGRAFNTSGGVEAEVEGPREQILHLICRIRTAPPPLAQIEEVTCTWQAACGQFDGFQIEASRTADETTLALPDTAPCPDCLRELYTPGDRHFRYPFINCTGCGPRYTILRALPYDRKNTAMDAFPMCADCQREYDSIEDRRCHAQPDCCPDCGPSYFFAGPDGRPVPGDPFLLAQKALARGEILAVRGTGGIHLACDARNQEAVLRLRARKRRPGRPLALMAGTPDEARSVCLLSPEEETLLAGKERPILLLKKHRRDLLPAVSRLARIGVMLPYTPAHYLLTDRTFDGPGLLVMTSANRSGCPVLTENSEALRALSGIADAFLLHNRAIVNRCDDSVAFVWNGAPYFLRRSRGYAPLPLSMDACMEGICALGAEQKASFALGQGQRLFLSPHIGDLKNLETLTHYETALRTYLRLFGIRPAALVCDLHPDYASTRTAQAMSRGQHLPLLQVQHHWAHMASCMADNGLTAPVFGIIWDGTGLGTDQTIWGGEFLTGDRAQFARAGSIRPVLLAGGDQATREIGRLALALLLDAGLPADAAPLPAEKRSLLTRLLMPAGGSSAGGGTLPAGGSFTGSSTLPAGGSFAGAVPASSIGRLFDGVYSLISQTPHSTYEGEAAALLEALSPWETREEALQTPKGRAVLENGPYPLSFYEEHGVRRFDTRPLVRAVSADQAAGRPPGHIAARFMDCLCRMALAQALSLNPEKRPVVLSGGVFQNRFLLSGVSSLLQNHGFTVFCHRRVSAGDEGLCLGQAAIAQATRAPSRARKGEL